MQIPAVHKRRVVVAATSAAILAFTALGIPVLHAQTGLEDSVSQQINQINADVSKKKSRLQQLSSQEQKFREAIAGKKLESASLEDDIALFDNRIAQTQLDIEIAEGEITGIELEMQSIDRKVELQEDRMGRQRVVLGSLARQLYRTQFRKSALDILLSGKSLSGFFDDMRQVADLQEGVSKSLHEVQALKAGLAAEKSRREEKKLALEDSKRKLDIARREIEDQRLVKTSILQETKASELEYRYQLAELKRQQQDASYEISSLEKRLREKVSLADRLKGQNTVLSWPLVPTRGLSTRFHDPDYPFRYVFEHPGIDVPSPQGTPVRAAAAGVIGRAKNAGMGYSYVMVLHNGGMSTVYGHISKIVAKEEAFVERGEIIGYSGGMPGTPGAGSMTTGPHLHFEARQDGIPVDPMRYLVAP